MALALDHSAWMRCDPAKALPALGPGECHLWLFSLDHPTAPISAIEGSLADDEWTRARRFHFEVHRRRFIAARGQLRILLAAYAGVAPEEVVFTYGPQGKPTTHLRDTKAARLDFNLSHTEGIGMLGITSCGAIGVDVEAVRPMDDAGDVARDNFSVPEVAVWEQLEPALQSDGFFACWTRKEAIVKALGGGLSIPLGSFQVTLDPSQPAQLLRIGAEHGSIGEWTIWGERVLPDCWAAAAIRAPRITFRRFCFA